MTKLKEQLREVWNLGGLSAKELARRLIHEIQEDNVPGYAAQLAYYFLFSLFPFFLFLTALLAYVPVPDLMDKIMELLGNVMPAEALDLLEDNIRELVTNQKGGLVSFGALVALWTASSAITAISDSLNRAYGVKEDRPFWKVRGMAILLTVALSVLLLLAMLLLIFGPHLGGFIAAKVGLGSAFAVAWEIVRWPLIVFLLIFAIALVYYLAPDVEQEWHWITPGSVFAIIGWLLASLGFNYYVEHFGSYNKTYGTIGAVIVLLTWMYLSGFLLLLGGEINAEIEHAARGGKAPGEKKIRAQS